MNEGICSPKTVVSHEGLHTFILIFPPKIGKIARFQGKQGLLWYRLLSGKYSSVKISHANGDIEDCTTKK